MITDADKEAFFQGYLTAALWSSTDTLPGDEDGQPVELDQYEWADGEAEKLRPDCLDFIQEHELTLECYAALRKFSGGNVWEYVGHDFWLTRNGHGVGFWDRDCGPYGDALTAAVGHGTPYSTVDLYFDDNHEVCCDSHPKAYAVEYRSMHDAHHYHLYYATLEAAKRAAALVSSGEYSEACRESIGCADIDYRKPPVYFYPAPEDLHVIYTVNASDVPDVHV